MRSRTYLAIDLKSFYASVECRERGLDPLDTNLVVADETRTDKTICLAVTPSLKSYGISGRGRLFEVRQRVKEVECRAAAPMRPGIHSPARLTLLRNCGQTRLLRWISSSHRRIWRITWRTAAGFMPIYMKYVAPEDMVVYSIDEVFMDVTGYLEHLRPDRA